MNLFTGVALNFIDAKMDYSGFNILDDSGWDISPFIGKYPYYTH